MMNILVAIPIYNAAEHLSNLLNDLYEFYQVVPFTIRFVFANDASTDPKVAALLLHHPFTKISNVSCITHASNIGFLRNVNSMLALREKQSAFLILNTDVRIRMNFLTALHAIASSKPNVGSITPLTSNGTLASVVNWPNGGQTEADLLSPLTNSLTVEPLAVEVPTGVGFCMYMSAEAINTIGGFNETFGAGYGEETEWCLRAVDAGFRNFLALNTFVAHVGTQSFTTKQKISQQKKAASAIEKTYPEYSLRVGNHYAQDSWRIYRLNLLVSATSNNYKAPIIQLLHADPESKHAGGTEAHVRRESINLSLENQLVIELFPLNSEFVCHLFWKGKILTKETYRICDLSILIELFEFHKASLHFHHLFNWPTDIVDRFVESGLPYKVFVHDFWYITPKVNLYCGQLSEASTAAIKKSSKPWLDRSAYILNGAKVITLPSDEMDHWFRIFFGVNSEKKKIVIKAHDLSYLKDLTTLESSHSETPAAKKIVFVGALYPHKGYQQLMKAIPLLRASGFDVVIFGKVPGFKNRAKGARIYPYEDASGLKHLFQTHRPSLAYFNSITPESFCFSLYETLLVSENTVPVVSPAGNPQRLIEGNTLGVVANGFDAKDIVEASKKALVDFNLYRVNILEWKAGLIRRAFYANTLHVEPSLSPTTRNRLKDQLLIYTTAGDYQDVYVSTLATKFSKAFKLLDKILRRFPKGQFLLKRGLSCVKLGRALVKL